MAANVPSRTAQHLVTASGLRSDFHDALILRFGPEQACHNLKGVEDVPAFRLLSEFRAAALQ
jgi:hypothetical protein